MRIIVGTLLLLLAAAAAQAQPPEDLKLTDITPAMSLFKPSSDDDGLYSRASIGKLIPVTFKDDSAAADTDKARSGSFAAEGASGTWRLEITRPPETPGRCDVELSLTWTGRPDALIASAGLRIPFAFGTNPRRTKIVAAAEGRPRGETWWVDQNDMWHVYWMLSDKAERWPLWRLGGIFQDSPDHCSVWKSNRADTSPLVVDQGKASPGWLDVSDAKSGVTVVWDEMSKRSPCALTVNYPEKTIEIWLHPAMSPAGSVESLGLAEGKTITWKFSVCLHDDVFPVTQRQELSREVYAELLRLIDRQKLWPFIACNEQVQLTGDLDARIRQAIDTGVQPSEILAYFDSGDRSKMQKLCAAAGAQWSTDHAANLKTLIDFCTRSAEEKAAARREPAPAK